MIDYDKVKKGDKLRIVGQGAPGFANIDDIVTVTECNGKNRVDVARADGKTTYFALTCGAARLEPVEEAEPPLPQREAEFAPLPQMVAQRREQLRNEREAGFAPLPPMSAEERELQNSVGETLDRIGKALL